MNVVQSKVTSKGIQKELNNGSVFFDTDDEMSMNKSQQQILDLVIHACDLSTPTRDFDCLREWTYLLFEEFFKQGDVEKDHGMPASFLCDRDTVQVAREQPGFVKFVVLPIWNVFTSILPGMEPTQIRAQENIVNWTNHEETEEEKRVYVMPLQTSDSSDLLH